MRHDFIRLKVKETMLKRNIKNVDIARILGTSEGYTSSILSGKATTTEDRWRVVCSALDINLDAILDAELQHRLPGIQTVHAAWESLLAGESYEPCEILTEAEETNTSSVAAATASPQGEAKEVTEPLPSPSGAGARLAEGGFVRTASVRTKTDEALPVMDATVTKRKIFVALTDEEITILLNALVGTLSDCIPERLDGLKNAENLRHMHDVTGLMLRLSEAV